MAVQGRTMLLFTSSTDPWVVGLMLVQTKSPLTKLKFKEKGPNFFKAYQVIPTGVATPQPYPYEEKQLQQAFLQTLVHTHFCFALCWHGAQFD